MKSIIKNKSNL